MSHNRTVIRVCGVFRDCVFRSLVSTRASHSTHGVRRLTHVSYSGREVHASLSTVIGHRPRGRGMAMGRGRGRRGRRTRTAGK